MSKGAREKEVPCIHFQGKRFVFAVAKIDSHLAVKAEVHKGVLKDKIPSIESSKRNVLKCSVSDLEKQAFSRTLESSVCLRTLKNIHRSIAKLPMMADLSFVSG